MNSHEIAPASRVLGHASATDTFIAYTQVSEVASGEVVGRTAKGLGHTSVAGTGAIYGGMPDVSEKPAP